MSAPFSLDTILNRVFNADTNTLKVDTEITLTGDVIINNIAQKPDGSAFPLQLDASGNLKIISVDAGKQETASSISVSGPVNISPGGGLIISANTNRREVLIRNDSATTRLLVGTSGNVVFPIDVKGALSIRARSAIYGAPESSTASVPVYTLEEIF